MINRDQQGAVVDQDELTVAPTVPHGVAEALVDGNKRTSMPDHNPRRIAQGTPAGHAQSLEILPRELLSHENVAAAVLHGQSRCVASPGTAAAAVSHRSSLLPGRDVVKPPRRGLGRDLL